jgi:hypothetical protein
MDYSDCEMPGSGRVHPVVSIGTRLRRGRVSEPLRDPTRGSTACVRLTSLTLTSAPTRADATCVRSVRAARGPSDENAERQGLLRYPRSTGVA